MHAECAKKAEQLLAIPVVAVGLAVGSCGSAPCSDAHNLRAKKNEQLLDLSIRVAAWWWAAVGACLPPQILLLVPANYASPKIYPVWP